MEGSFKDVMNGKFKEYKHKINNGYAKGHYAGEKITKTNVVKPQVNNDWWKTFTVVVTVEGIRRRGMPLEFWMKENELARSGLQEQDFRTEINGEGK